MGEEETVEFWKAIARSIAEGTGKAIAEELVKIYEVLVKIKEKQLALSEKLKELDKRVKKLESQN